ncbi:hypothetical protein FB446DRAFT_757118 [Lentinula raphanica]|nr:hypothetical protein FB446DRAFT_757118 [Lentinula raphanica]
MNSSLLSTGVVQPEQSRSTYVQGSLLDIERRGVEDVNLVPQADKEKLKELFAKLLDHNNAPLDAASRREFDHLTNILLSEDESVLSLGIPSNYRGQVATPADRQRLYVERNDVRADINAIIDDSEAVAACPHVISQAFLRRAKQIHDKALDFLSDGAKDAAREKMSEAQTARQKDLATHIDSPRRQRQ